MRGDLVFFQEGGTRPQESTNAHRAHRWSDTSVEFCNALQEEDSDADTDAATSEGIFVYDPDATDVQVGDTVRVTGEVTEFSELTELRSVSSLEICPDGAGSVTPAAVNLPVDAVNDLEAFEGMLVMFDQELTVTENFNLGRFGSVTLSPGGRLFQFTHTDAPDVAGYTAHQEAVARNTILLDDGRTNQNPDPVIHPAPELSADNTLRSGDTVTGLTGVMSYSFGDYRIQPVGVVEFDHDNTRQAAPNNVGGTLKVASFNVLNYFTTIDNGSPICGPEQNQDCRGADSAEEFTRQRDKIISALVAIDADVVGLIELENNAVESLQDLVNGLNDELGEGTYAFVDTGTIGDDAIKVGLIYKPTAVKEVGTYEILDSSDDPNFIDTKNRPVLAQTFEDTNGGRFTVAVNHFKSKGSDCDSLGDPDVGDGQGNCNQTRTKAAQALAAWLSTDPTSSNDPDFLIIGDLNSYVMEDPITTLKQADYTDLINQFNGGDAYSFIFFGEAGYLDYALSSESLTPQVNDATVWHINADEPRVLDYNVEFKGAQVEQFYNPDSYRSSDHDAVIVGLELVPSCNGETATVYVNSSNKVVGGPRNGRRYLGILWGTSGDDVIVGTSSDEIIKGLKGDDLICGQDGDDAIIGDKGDDTIYGGNGNDALAGQQNNDRLYGEAGNDLLKGGSGDDILTGGEHADIFNGGSGTDTAEDFNSDEGDLKRRNVEQ